ncbi:MAG: murein biosynthesis integral membrane protein MurJ, partial [Candidatus Riflebacteria bacterium]|nr:murein biosynthesis integral membrane protein MurJ [Candidatus Riflebacteria bacterium]
MKKTALILILITMFSKLLGFFREITLSYFYGASSFSDLYLIAVSIPNVLFDFLAIAISTTFIPIYNEISLEKSEKEANRFTNNLTSMIILLCTLIVIVFFLFTKEILGIFAKG